MANWEEIHNELHDLYIVQNETLKNIMELMQEKHNFKASKFDYETRFKKLNWHKKMKKCDWLYVARKTKQSGRKESAVYFYNVKVPPAKVKKEVARQVHPNDFYTFGALPPSPGYVTVCTPPPDGSVLGSSSRLIPTTGKRKLDSGSFHDLSPSKSRRTEPVDILMLITKEFPSSTVSSWRNHFFATGKVDLKGLPYFQLRDILNSPDVVEGFERILTSNDALAQGLISHFWPQATSPTRMLQSIPSRPPSSFGFDIDDEWDLDTPYSQFPTQMQLYKPFGVNLLRGHSICQSSDVIEILRKSSWNLQSVLTSMPQTSGKEVQALTDLLLGPPTIEAARRFVEIGIYISSNNLAYEPEMDKFIDSMMEFVPWSVLQRILSAPVPTIQAFTEKVFRFAVRKQKISIVQDLLDQPSLTALVQSDTKVLVSAVWTSNLELVGLLLKAGADPNGNTYNRPIIEARTAGIAELLVCAGADANALGRFFLGENYDEPCEETSTIYAARRGDLELVQYFTSIGVDVNKYGLISRVFSGKYQSIEALFCAINCGKLKIVQLLLQAGAKVNGINYGCGILGLGACDRECGCTGITALQRAAALGNLGIARSLVQHEATINAPAFGKHGETALQAAVSNGHVEMVRYLLEVGADVNAPGNSNNQFPNRVLTTAVENGNDELVEIILDAGAATNTASFGDFGCTALESAMLMKNSNIYDLLVARGTLHITTKPDSKYFQARLRVAITIGDYAWVEQLVDSGTTINDTYFTAKGSRQRKSLLQYALSSNVSNASIIFQLLFDRVRESNGKVNFYPLLIEATKLGKLDLLTTLLDAGANVNSAYDGETDVTGTPLMFAVHDKDIKTVKFLLDKGADVNLVIESFRLSSSLCVSTALQISLYDKDGDPISLEIFHLLLKHNAEINAYISKNQGLSELALAVMTGDIGIVQYLLELGAEINQPPGFTNGSTARQEAVDSSSADISIVRLLLDWGADVNGPISREHGYTALWRAAFWGNFQIALILLEVGADVNAKCSGIATPLMAAANAGRLDIVHLLLKAGADMHLPEDERYSAAAERARRRGNIAILSILEKWKHDAKSQSHFGTSHTHSMGKERAIEPESEEEEDEDY